MYYNNVLSKKKIHQLKNQNLKNNLNIFIIGIKYEGIELHILCS